MARTDGRDVRRLGFTVVTVTPAEVAEFELDALLRETRRSMSDDDEPGPAHAPAEDDGPAQLSFPGLAGPAAPTGAGDAAVPGEDTVPLVRQAKDESWEGWTGQPAVALLVMTPPLGSAQGPQLVGLAQGRARVRGKGKRFRRLDVSGIDLLESRVGWNEVTDRLAEGDRAGLASNADGRPELVRDRRAQRLQEALLAAAGHNRHLAARLHRAATRADPLGIGAGGRAGRRRDVLRVSGMDGAEGSAVESDEVPQPVREHWERFFIRHDARSLHPSWSREDAPATWWRYEKNGRRLFVLDSDADEGEAELGGDLVYLRAQPAALLVVQYKRLTSSSGRRDEGVCTIDERLLGQLERMAALSQIQAPDAARSPDGYRMSSTCGFVKLINAWEQEVAGELFPGLYLPADYLQLLIGSARDGTVLIDKERDRSIDPQTFVRLVADGWIGSSGGNTEQLMDRLDAAELLEEPQPHTVATELPAPPKAAPGRRRSS